MLNLIDEDSVHAEGNPGMEVEDWTLGTSSWIRAGVLTRRAHQQEPIQESLWMNGPKWLEQDKSDWHIARVLSFDSWFPEIEQFKITKKKPLYPTTDVNMRPMNILERHAIAIVVKKTRDNQQ